MHPNHFEMAKDRQAEWQHRARRGGTVSRPRRARWARPHLTRRLGVALVLIGHRLAGPEAPVGGAPTLARSPHLPR
jgi:hypothetical protein